MSDLRNEIIETQKARTEFFKWKLIGAAALGATGLGLTEHGSASHAYFVLALIPLVCIFVDLMCWHFSLRILVIGTFLHLSHEGDQAPYERFVERCRHLGRDKNMNVFALEDWALEGSTWTISFLVATDGVVQLLIDLNRFPAWGEIQDLLIIASGMIGIGVSLIWKSSHRRRIRDLNSIADLRG